MVEQIKGEYDDFWKEQHQGRDVEAAKQLNPIRSLENLRAMIQKTEMGYDTTLEDQQLKKIEQDKVKQKFYDSSPNYGNRIVIRKIARDMQSQYMEDENGNHISFEEWEYKNKFIDYKSIDWPSPSGVNAISMQSNGSHIQNYRYPV